MPSPPAVPPLFLALRRRHLDVDLVLLPPESTGPPADHASPDEVDRAVREVAGEAERLLAPLLDTAITSLLEYAEDEAAVRPVATSVSRRPDGAAVLTELRSRLTEAGWDTGPALGRLTGLRARRVGLSVAATYAASTGTLSVRLAGPASTVGVDAARAWVRRGSAS